MEDCDPVGYASLDTAASSPFKDHDNGFGEYTRAHGSTNSFHERSGCSWSIPPPAARPGPDHIRRINEKHYRGLTVPAFRGTPSTTFDVGTHVAECDKTRWNGGLRNPDVGPEEGSNHRLGEADLHRTDSVSRSLRRFPMVSWGGGVKPGSGSMKRCARASKLAPKSVHS
jgi:hypothetical protein